MPRKHRAAGRAARLVPAGSAAPSQRLNAMDRRCPARIGGGANRAAGCVDRPDGRVRR